VQYRQRCLSTIDHRWPHVQLVSWLFQDYGGWSRLSSTTNTGKVCSLSHAGRVVLSHLGDTKVGGEMKRTALPHSALNPDAALHHRHQA